MYTYYFPNRLTMLYQHSLNSSLSLTCICLFVNLGSAQEPDNLRGVSHLIEHMMFKATKNRSEDSLLRIFDSTGAKFNAYTSKRLTCYYIICETKYMKQCLEALSEMVTHAIFDKHELGKEQKVVREENVEDEYDPSNLLLDGVDMALFEGTHYAYPVDFIHSPLDRKQVIDYYHTHYIPKNMALSIVSSASYEAVKRTVFKTPFARLHSFHPHAAAATPTTVSVTPICVLKEHKPDEKEIQRKIHPIAKYEQYKMCNGLQIIYGKIPNYNTIHIAIAFRTCNWRNYKDRSILWLIKMVFSRGLNGRLYNVLRGKHGLAYSPSAGTEYHDTTGKFSLYTEIEANKLIEFQEDGKRKKGVLPILFELLQDFIKNGPTAKEWEDAKGYSHGERLINMERINYAAEHNGKNYWLNLDDNTIMDYSVSKKHTQQDTLEDCRECIRKYFVPSSMCIALVGSSLPSIGAMEKCIEQYLGL